jgi:hypothetical protein
MNLTPEGRHLSDRLAGKMHTVEALWKLKNSERLVITPAPLLVLAVRARRDVELLHLRVDYPELGNADMAGAVAEAVLVEVPHVVGLRRLRPEGEPYVRGQEGIPAAAMFGSKPEDRAGQPEQVRWYGGTVRAIEYNRNAAPNIWWSWRGRVLVPKGRAVGLIVRCNQPTTCRALLAGV